MHLFRLIQVACGLAVLAFYQGNAQQASVKWNLTSNNRVSQVVGRISGANQLLSRSALDPNLELVVKDYAASGSNTGQRIWPKSTSWPAETQENAGRYIEFKVVAPVRTALHITSIAIEVAGGGTGSFRCNTYYSMEDTFTNRVKINTSSTVPSGTFQVSTFPVDINRTGNQNLYVRIYPWYNFTSPGSAKYFYLRNVVVSGSYTVTNETIAPSVNTGSDIMSISTTSARGSGNVTYDGGDVVTERGLCWNTTGLPLLTDNKATSGSGVGAYTADLVNLIPGTTYYVRAFATNSVGTGYGNELMFVAAPYTSKTLAFPGAEGWGKYTVGGRGGTVYEVTNLNDGGPGSLRAAVEASGPRTVVFRVSGTIILNSKLNIVNPYITIAGQTAPGDGICVRRYPIYISGDNIILRYIRCRLGDETGGESDALFARWHKNIIIDHCSFSWSADETLSVYWCDSTTIQWCLVSESMYNSSHPKGAHGYGGIWGGPRATYHHNLMAHHSSRNPRFASGCGVTDFRNNVIYNWGFNSSYGGEKFEPSLSVSEASRINMVANYYKPGPATKAGMFQYRIANPGTRDGLADYGRWHIEKNVVHFNEEVTADNWTLGVQGPTSDEKDSIRARTPIECIPIIQQHAIDAYHSVLNGVGAILPKRDSVDLRVLKDVSEGNATFEGPTYRDDMGFPTSWPITGIIDSQNDVGGWPVLNTGVVPVDTDHDGMPDEWELAHGLNPGNPGDGQALTPSGYTNLETYLNGNNFGSVSSAMHESPTETDVYLYPNYPNPFNPATTVRFSISRPNHVSVKVYSLLGQHITTLMDGVMSAGSHEVVWNAELAASGTYVLAFRVGNVSYSRKLMLIK